MEKFEKDFFDENFFLYFEEIDLCKKVKNKGGKIYISKNIIINHDGASSVNTKMKSSLKKIEIGIGCGQLFIFIKSIKVLSLH